MPHEFTRVVANTRLDQVPRWAELQRAVFDEADAARKEFERLYCEPDGSLRFAGRLGLPPDDRDGVDDFYEAFFNWPMLYALGGPDDLLAASQHHWEGVTRQLTEQGMVVDEYEQGYDWFHQGESQLFFYGLCLAAPDDPATVARAERFAALYADPAAGNYDPRHRIIRSPHTGARGAREGLQSGDPLFPWSKSFPVYGLPLDDVEGVTDFEQLLADPELARRFGQAMGERMGRGDNAVNLASTSLVTTAWLLDHDSTWRDWILEYTNAWAERASQNGGLIPDNVGRSGAVGEYHHGKWFGGHYGWTWPHGWHSVGAGVTIGALNAALVTGDEGRLSMARDSIDSLLALGIDATAADIDEPFRGNIGLKIRQDWSTPMRLVPFRHRESGWFDYHEMDVAFPLALWLASGAREDLERLRDIRDRSGYDWRTVHAFRGKDEGGHGEPWFAYLEGDNPDYPEQMLELARRVIRERVEAMSADTPHTEITRIHHWQGMNPVMTEALLQLTCGAPQVLYNGGLLIARVRYFDDLRKRPGLPQDVAALVTGISEDETELELVNLGDEPRSLVVQAGGLREHLITEAAIDGQPIGVDAGHLAVDLPPRSRVILTLRLRLHAQTPTLELPWKAVDE